jgi:hypothetical protein
MRPEALLACLAATLGAAEPERPHAEATIQLISLAGDLEDLALWDGRQATPVRVSADFFGPRLRYAGDPRLTLVRLAPAGAKPAAETKGPGEPRPPGDIVAWLDLPPATGPRKLILLVQPEAAGGGIHAMPDEEGGFPSGSIRFLNFCPYRVEVVGRDRTTALPAKGSAVVRPSVPRGGYYDAEIRTEEDQVSRLAYHLHFFHAPERRTLLFILPGEKGSGLVRLQPVEEPPMDGTGGSKQDALVKPPKTR